MVNASRNVRARVVVLGDDVKTGVQHAHVLMGQRFYSWELMVPRTLPISCLFCATRAAIGRHTAATRGNCQAPGKKEVRPERASRVLNRQNAAK